MWFCTIERLYICDPCMTCIDRNLTGIYRSHELPFEWRQVTSTRWLCCFVLPVTAGQAHCSHLPDLSLLGYFILSDSQRAGNHRAGTLVTRVSGEMKVLFSHRCPPEGALATLQMLWS